jgi:hypothetical protein
MSLYDSLNDGPGLNVTFNALPALAWARANGMRDHALALVHLAWQSNAAVESTATVRGESKAKRKAEAAGLIAPGLSTGDALRRIVRDLTSAGMPAEMADPWVLHYHLGAVESESDPVSSASADHGTPAARRTDGEPNRHGGIPYISPVRPSGKDQQRSVIFQGNPDLIDRGTAAHKDIQDALHAHVVANGLQSISPAPHDQQFDIAWVSGGTLHICEVKSLTNDNEETQLRLGLGQLLSYMHRTNVEHWAGVDEITGVLAVEHQPSRTDWVQICARNGVTLTWPRDFPRLFNQIT